MGSGADRLQPPAGHRDAAGQAGPGDSHPCSALAACSAVANGEAAMDLLLGLLELGLRHLVLCPGSRSAPLAVAAGLLECRGLVLHTAIDERSAAFFALGLGRADGLPAAVVTTSGTAVAQLLAAAVEADLGTIPLLLLTADRPERLKRCGANQAVPQEHFLSASARLVLQGPPDGLATAGQDALRQLALQAMAAAVGDGRQRPAGPVHLNLPFEEPLHADAAALQHLAARAASRQPGIRAALNGPQLHSPERTRSAAAPSAAAQPPRLDPDRPGVVVAGPWRGDPQVWADHGEALIRWQQRSGWPVLADPLSGLRGLPGLEVVSAYDLLLETPRPDLGAPQVLRLGSLPASRRLERWLQDCGGDQVLVSHGDPRRLDPLGTVPPQAQWSGGLPSWLAAQALAASPDPGPSAAARDLAQRWQRAERAAQQRLDQALTPATPIPPEEETEGAAADLSEPWLARALSRLLPAGVPLMLASSSPVRDWAAFADPRAPWRPIHGFRGASGIDGTLSIACGLAESLGQLVLMSGDLALLHDANGWLWHRRLRGRLTVVLIENGGGGIFEQLPIRPPSAAPLDFERLFAMPQAIDQLALAALHGVPGRRLQRRADLAADLAWALAQPFALLEVPTRRNADARWRQQLRRSIAAPDSPDSRAAPGLENGSPGC